MLNYKFVPMHISNVLSVTNIHTYACAHVHGRFSYDVKLMRFSASRQTFKYFMTNDHSNKTSLIVSKTQRPT